MRGVTSSAPLVRRNVRLTDGKWPSRNEVIVGNLAAAKLGYTHESLSIGKQIEFEGKSWTIVGHYSAGGAAFESEIWCNLSDFQSATKRQDITLVALLFGPNKSTAELELFCKMRTDLELKAISESRYYQQLQQHYKPMRILAWLVVLIVSSAGVFAGLNMMYGAVAGRVREIATLRAMGFRRRAILASLLQEGVLLSASASLLAGAIAVTVLNGMAVRFTMGAFKLQIDSVAVVIGCSVSLLLGILGALPPTAKALRANVAVSLKAV